MKEISNEARELFEGVLERLDGLADGARPGSDEQGADAAEMARDLRDAMIASGIEIEEDKL